MLVIIIEIIQIIAKNTNINESSSPSNNVPNKAKDKK